METVLNQPVLLSMDVQCTYKTIAKIIDSYSNASGQIKDLGKNIWEALHRFKRRSRVKFLTTIKMQENFEALDDFVSGWFETGLFFPSFPLPAFIDIFLPRFSQFRYLRHCYCQCNCQNKLSLCIKWAQTWKTLPRFFPSAVVGGTALIRWPVNDLDRAQQDGRNDYSVNA